MLVGMWIDRMKGELRRNLESVALITSKLLGQSRDFGFEDICLNCCMNYVELNQLRWKMVKRHKKFGLGIWRQNPFSLIFIVDQRNNKKEDEFY
jgi:hypothetical protein